jgi:hypothetical protein
MEDTETKYPPMAEEQRSIEKKDRANNQRNYFMNSTDQCHERFLEVPNNQK